jgi:hypothetical protein
VTNGSCSVDGIESHRLGEGKGVQQRCVGQQWPTPRRAGTIDTQNPDKSVRTIGDGCTSCAGNSLCKGPGARAGGRSPQGLDADTADGRGSCCVRVQMSSFPRWAVCDSYFLSRTLKNELCMILAYKLENEILLACVHVCDQMYSLCSS